MHTRQHPSQGCSPIQPFGQHRYTPPGLASLEGCLLPYRATFLIAFVVPQIIAQPLAFKAKGAKGHCAEAPHLAWVLWALPVQTHNSGRHFPNVERNLQPQAQILAGWETCIQKGDCKVRAQKRPSPSLRHESTERHRPIPNRFCPLCCQTHLAFDQWTSCCQTKLSLICQIRFDLFALCLGCFVVIWVATKIA